MSLVNGALLVLCLAALAWWGQLAAEWAIAERRGRSLDDVPVPEPDGLPSLSVVVPARDEARTLPTALPALLAALPPGGEVVLVDDRSQDGTASLAVELAAGDPRLRVIRVDRLPEGWLGKTHALQVGADASAGEWILFTDADVRYLPGSLALALAAASGADHLVVTPRLDTRGFWERVFVLFFLVLFNGRFRTWRASDPSSGFFAGLGAFNMVRREAYLRAGGHRPLRSEVIDDVHLGRILKEAGALTRVVGGSGLVKVRWNEGLGGLVAGVEKNAYAAMGYQPWRAALACLALLAVTVVPACSLLAWRGSPVTAVTGLGTWAAFAVLYALAARHTGNGWSLFWTFPIGAALMVWAILGSAIAYHRHGGVRWRGTVYRRGARDEGRGGGRKERKDDRGS